MIDSHGFLRCDNCGKKLASELKGEVKIVCPRCKTFNAFRYPQETLEEREQRILNRLLLEGYQGMLSEDFILPA